jgi:ubiquinone/menaquinone biosynthesis C-methylase UbiE
MTVDIGTGSGLWAIQVAEEYPNAKVIGTDISPVQPNEVPPNCEFQLENLLEGLSFDTGNVDFLHSRYFLSALHALPHA